MMEPLLYKGFDDILINSCQNAEIAAGTYYSAGCASFLKLFIWIHIYNFIVLDEQSITRPEQDSDPYKEYDYPQEHISHRVDGINQLGSSDAANGNLKVLQQMNKPVLMPSAESQNCRTPKSFMKVISSTGNGKSVTRKLFQSPVEYGEKKHLERCNESFSTESPMEHTDYQGSDTR